MGHRRRCTDCKAVLMFGIEKQLKLHAKFSNVDAHPAYDGSDVGASVIDVQGF